MWTPNDNAIRCDRDMQIGWTEYQSSRVSRRVSARGYCSSFNWAVSIAEIDSTIRPNWALISMALVVRVVDLAAEFQRRHYQAIERKPCNHLWGDD